MPGISGQDDGDLICRYGAGYLLKQISALRKEIPGVLAARDIEHIHRMRVATRRLRAALPLFPLCHSEKRIRRWRRGLRETARALGEARDTDVQIDFLTGYIANLKAGRPAGSPARLPAVVSPQPPPVPFRKDRYHLSLAFRKLRWSLQSALSSAGEYLGRILGEKGPAATGREGGPRDLVPGTESILLRKTQERAGLQKGIGKAIWRMEKNGLLGEMEQNLRRHGKRAGGSPATTRGLSAIAFTSVTTRIDELLAFGEALADPGKIREHHAMRIAVKRLRYTLEVWRDLFEGDLKEEIDTLKELQGLLGDLHDCDVWIGYLPGFLREEEARCRDFFGDDHHFRSLVPGIEAFARERGERRRELHGTALAVWRDLAVQGFWDGLREQLLLPLAGPPGGPVRIGLLAGISGDAPALRMVLADGRARGAGLFLNAGDIVGSPRTTRETVEILREEGIVSVAGRRDREILDGIPSPGPGGDGEAGDTGKGHSKVTRRFIRALPSSLRLSFGTSRLLLTSGSPDLSFDGATTGERLGQIAREAGASVIVSGRSGLPFTRKEGQVLFVNPGAVGRGEGKAASPSYVILEFGPENQVTAIHHEVRSGPTGTAPDIPFPPAAIPGIPVGGEGQPKAGED